MANRSNAIRKLKPLTISAIIRNGNGIPDVMHIDSEYFGGGGVQGHPVYHTATRYKETLSRGPAGHVIGLEHEQVRACTT